MFGNRSGALDFPRGRKVDAPKKRESVSEGRFGESRTRRVRKHPRGFDETAAIPRVWDASRESVGADSQ